MVIARLFRGRQPLTSDSFLLLELAVALNRISSKHAIRHGPFGIDSAGHTSDLT